MAKGVKVEVGNEEAAVDLAVVIKYGANLKEVSEAVQQNVRKAIEMMTGLRVVEVNVNVQGIFFEKEKEKEKEIVEPVSRVK